jgi:hypothetical protein
MVPGTAINFYPLSYADRRLWQEVLNHARKLRVSKTTEIKFLGRGRSPAGKLLSTMWTNARLVAAEVSLRGPDMSPVDLHLGVVSEDAAGLDC